LSGDNCSKVYVSRASVSFFLSPFRASPCESFFEGLTRFSIWRSLAFSPAPLLSSPSRVLSLSLFFVRGGAPPCGGSVGYPLGGARSSGTGFHNFCLASSLFFSYVLAAGWPGLDRSLRARRALNQNFCFCWPSFWVFPFWGFSLATRSFCELCSKKNPNQKPTKPTTRCNNPIRSFPVSCFFSPCIPPIETWTLFFGTIFSHHYCCNVTCPWKWKRTRSFSVPGWGDPPLTHVHLVSACRKSTTAAFASPLSNSTQARRPILWPKKNKKTRII